jgi:hypothetical protein
VPIGDELGIEAASLHVAPALVQTLATQLRLSGREAVVSPAARNANPFQNPAGDLSVCGAACLSNDDFDANRRLLFAHRWRFDFMKRAKIILCRREVIL